MLLFVTVLSIIVLFLTGYSFYCRKQVQKLTKEIDSFLLYSEVSSETLKEGLFSNLANQLRKLEAQLLFEKKHNRKREIEMTQFIENMAHQIKTTLTVLQIRLDLAQAESSDSNDLMQSQASLERLTAEIERILKSSQLASGKIKMDFCSFNYPDLIQDCISSLSSLAGKKNVTFQSHIPQHCPISADYFWLLQAVMNIMKNAVEHTPSNTSVSIDLQDFHNTVLLTISDSGKGVPIKELPEIFLRFHRGSASKSGYGIGLSMAKDIVEAHHGALTVKNLPDKGCSFLLSLPQFLEGKVYHTN